MPNHRTTRHAVAAHRRRRIAGRIAAEAARRGLQAGRGRSVTARRAVSTRGARSGTRRSGAICACDCAITQGGAVLTERRGRDILLVAIGVENRIAVSSTRRAGHRCGRLLAIGQGYPHRSRCRHPGSRWPGDRSQPCHWLQAARGRATASTRTDGDVVIAIDVFAGMRTCTEVAAAVDVVTGAETARGIEIADDIGTRQCTGR